MNMEQVIARINELAKKAKAEGRYTKYWGEDTSRNLHPCELLL